MKGKPPLKRVPVEDFIKKMIEREHIIVPSGQKGYAAVARVLGMNSRSFWESQKRGKLPPLERIVKYCEKTGCSLDDLVFDKAGIEVVLDPKIDIVSMAQAEEITTDAFRKGAYLSFPIYKDPVILGHDIDPREYEFEEIPCLMHYSAMRIGMRIRCVRVIGESMKPVLDNGCTVCIDLSQTNPYSLKDQIVAADISDDQKTARTIKKLVLLSKDDLYLEALNKEWERDYGQIRKRLDEVKICGKVVWWWGKPST